MKTRTTYAVAATGALLCMQVALADVVQMKNGDRISGKLASMTGDKLIITTEYGEVGIMWSEVSGLSTDEPTEIMLDDETVLSGVLSNGSTGTFNITSSEIAQSTPVAMTRVSYINPPPEVTGRGLKLHARVNAGAARSSGNTDTQSIHLDGEVVARGVTNRYTLGAIFNQSEDSGVENTNNSTGYMKYDHFLDEKWYGYVNGIFTKDKFKDLNLRTALGVGAGYQAFESSLTNLSVEAGLNYVNEDFDVAADDSYPAARWALNYDRYLLTDSVQFFHMHEIYFGLKDSSNILLRSQTGLRVPLFQGVNATAQVNYDRDKSPPTGTKKADTAYLFTLGYAL